MPRLFETFPELKNDAVIIRKMTDADVDALMEITENDNVYKFIPPFLYKKSRKTLLTAIKNLVGRDFDKQKLIIAGIYPTDGPDHLVGLAEMFDYKKKADVITVGYRVNENYWHKGIATNALNLMTAYLSDEIGIKTLTAFVMPENKYSVAVLQKNGYKKAPETVREKNWGGQAEVELDVYTYKKQ